MEQGTRNKLRNVVTQCRKLLEESVSQTLQGKFGIYAGKKDTVHIEDESRMAHLSEEDQTYRQDLLNHFEHIKARGFKDKDALDQLIREIAFTHLNRLCAYKMMEARQVYVSGQRFREAVSRGINSNGFKFYLADHPEDERLFSTGNQELAYRHFLDWLGGLLSEEIGVLFNPNDPANRLYPRQKTLDELLDLINDEELAGIWEQDETIGWVYQYFTPKELRDKARKESQAPRNSYELAFRNQFFTPRYVVEFLTDNTLGRIWYEMRKGDTKLKEQCRYMVRRPNEIFLDEGQELPQPPESQEDLSQEELLRQPVYISHRPKKDPRELKILDPACGSGHFLLYCFDLLLTIYEEAYSDPDLGSGLQQDYPTLNDLRQDAPRLILAHNLHGIDIDLRASQIAALALWLRCQRAYQEMELKKDRPKITRSNFVCAEPMPGEEEMLKEFTADLQPKVLGQLVEVVFDRMRLAGDLGSLLRIEDELRAVITEAKKQWQQAPKEVQLALFEKQIPIKKQEQLLLFDISGITDSEFWDESEANVLSSLKEYATKATNGNMLQRQLFVDDSARGFALIDICKREYDVILMNPPFGEAIPSTRGYIGDTYHTASADIGACFIERGAWLNRGGLIGTLATRTYLTNEGLVDWRRSRLLGDSSVLAAFADLGFGVLDDAKVEAAVYITGPGSPDQTVQLLNVLHTPHKDSELLELVTAPTSKPERHRPVRRLRLFRNVPGNVLCYWLPTDFLSACLATPNLKALDSQARVGLQTGDNNRFVRAVWEVPQRAIGKNKDWAWFAKGGEYEPFYDDIHLVVYWANNGEVIKNFKDDRGKLLSRPQNLDHYFKEGVTYPDRTTSDFSPRIMPKDIIFSSTGFALFPPNRQQTLGYLGAAYTRPFKILVEPFVGSGDFSASGSMARHYRPGVLNVLPNFLSEPKGTLCERVRRSIELRAESFSDDETTRYFTCLTGIGSAPSLHACANRRFHRQLTASLELLQHNIEIEREVVHTIGGQIDAEQFDTLYAVHPSAYNNQPSISELEPLVVAQEGELIDTAKEQLGASRHIFMKSYFADRRLELICHILQANPESVVEIICKSGLSPKEYLSECAISLVQYAVGCVFGRWDVRIVDSHLDATSIDPFSALPVCAPGMLQQSDGLPATTSPNNYPLRIDWDGIITDDPQHQDDIVGRAHEVLELFWEEKSNAIEHEACDILCVKSLRDYFRKPAKGGFWDDHVKRYSKSRRKAPIYWLLQSSRKNYALWLYYHRLDKDILFKALLNYIEPKSQREENHLSELRSKKISAGDSGKESKKLDRDIEKQEDLLSELRDFEEKLRRVANLHLEPDLNDGVVLNIAPLHELVPWNEAKKYWEELLDGKYEWSSIGKQLRERGLVK